MPPAKKDDKKKGGAPAGVTAAAHTITEDDLEEAKSLPPLNDFVFTNFYAFKYTRNEARLGKQIKKLYSYTNVEDPEYSEDLAQKYRTIDMNQLLAQAQARGLLTEQEVAEPSEIDPEKKRRALAQSTMESVTAFQLQLRQKKKAELEAAPAEAQDPKGSAPATPKTPADGVVTGERTPKTPPQKLDQILLLQDFPKTAEDAKCLFDIGFTRLNGAFLIEEAFNRDIEDENDDDTKPGGLATAASTGMSAGEQSAAELADGQEPAAKKKAEKQLNRLSERVAVFSHVLETNRLLKRLQGACFVERQKFTGPENPMEIPTPPEDGSEPEPVDEERKAREFKFYDEFALRQRQTIEEVALDLQAYHYEKKLALKSAKPLWPAPVDPEAQAKLEELERLRKSQIEMKLKEEEEKRAAEAAAAQKGGGKKSQQKQRAGTQASGASKDGEPAEGDKGLQDAEDLLNQIGSKQFASRDDDPSKKWNFHQYQKATIEMNTGTTTVGSILGAMVYQISSNTQKKHKDALNPDLYRQQEVTKKLSSAGLRKKSTMELLRAPPKPDVDLSSVFEDALHKLQIEHSVVETDYKHPFDEQQLQKDNELKSSPYMVVKSDNDRILTDQGAYNYLSGAAQDAVEQRTLQTCLIPGVNKRLGMPDKASMKQSQREADCDQIIRFCQLPPNQTKRCLILRAFEIMMKKNIQERDFSFLDRNYLEEYKDANTMRQILQTAVNQLRPDMITEYFEMDDGLLVSMFFKNPPGRLLRRQWTNDVKVFPEFSEWKATVKGTRKGVDMDQLLDIAVSKVGALRCNTKFSFPSDNSVIRVDKYSVGQRRMGESQIIKDNFMFGIGEKRDVFYNKAEAEDTLRNRDAKQLQDKRCDFWLVFENGVRLSIDMQDKLDANMEMIPLSQIPAWLKTKIEREQQRQAELEELQSETIARKSGGGDGSGPDGTAEDAMSAGGSLVNSGDEGRQTKVSKVTDGRGQTPGSEHRTGAAGSGTRSPEAGEDGQAKAHDGQDQDPKLQEVGGLEDIVEEDDPELKDPNILIDGVDMTSGAKLTFTFNEGLVVQIQPNGDVLQKIINDSQMPKSQTKGNNMVKDDEVEAQIEEHRVITTNGEIIKQMADGNFIIYFADGSITYSDKRRGVWYTISAAGVKRVRKVKDKIVQDEVQKLRIDTKVDPETNAVLKIREDGVLSIEYIDASLLIVMPDGTNILKKKRPDGEAGTVTLITKDGFVPIRQIYDPVKARAKTIIGLGGTDALMGKDQIMERTNTGKISEVLLPDKTVVQSYLEKQELEGYNNFSTSMIHIIRRDDYSVVKVRQDGEVVLITANERSYLNDIGKQIDEFGTKDYDYFFELFGIPNERRSGAYTANLDKGRIWTQDEEGNYFIVYANGDSVEKLSVSFNLDQMVEGIENKEPDSPRIRDGEYIEDECKFLPPPKSMAHPRLFYIKNDGSGVEYFNQEQLEHTFRTYRKRGDDPNLIQTSNRVKIQNEDSISHVFIAKKHKVFDAQAFNVSAEFPKLPQNLELVNQTVSIPTEPVVEQYTYKNVLEFSPMDDGMVREFLQAVGSFERLKQGQKKREADLRIKEPKITTQAAPPQADTQSRMRSSAGMQSTMMMSNISPRSGDSGSNSMVNSSTSHRISPRLLRAQAKALGAKKQQEGEAVQGGEEAIENAEEAAEEIDIDDQTGMQLYKNELEDQLTFMEKLQLRIAKERSVNIDTLKGDEFKVLKDYKKLEERKELMNNVNDFFDPRYAVGGGDDLHHDGNIRVSKMGGGPDSRPQLLSDHGEKAFYSQDSHLEIKKEFNMLTINN